MFGIRMRSVLTALAVAGLLGLVVADADARPRAGFGSRGSRTFSAPPPTTTAPIARPVQRSVTPAPTAPRPGATSAAPARPGFFNRPGLLGGLAAGLLGAGLFGLLFGHGMFGNLAGLASVFGLLLQLALIGGVGFMIYRWWQRRSQPHYAGVGSDNVRPMKRMGDFGSSEAGNRPMGLGGAAAGAGGLGGAYGGAATNAPSDAIGITPADYDAFERLLGEVQSAYGREDIAALRMRVTPEMLSYFSEDFANYASRGVVNELSGVKLLQGDLAEAWREGDTDYATVAMRYEIVDRTVERATGREVEGSSRPVEVVELWTFRRSRGGAWILSAIQEGGAG